jgi:hypothetical protein
MFVRLMFLFIFYFSVQGLYADKLLLMSDAPYILQDKEWKYFFKAKSWKQDEVYEADKHHLFIYLNAYRIPKGMNWKKPSWGLWNVKENHFIPLDYIPSNMIPLRIIGDRIFLKSKISNSYSYIDMIGKKNNLLKSSANIKAWFPRADGSIAFILNSNSCGNFSGKPEKDSLWSVCLLSSDFDSIDLIQNIPEVYNSMITGNSDNYLVYWRKSIEESLWIMDSVDLDTQRIKTIAKSNRTEITQDNPPKWLSWIERNWVAYQKIKTPSKEAAPEKNRSFILHNLKTDQKKEVQLEGQGTILLEPGNFGKRQYEYQPYLVVLDYANEKKPIKVIDIGEMKIIFETYFPLPLTPDSKERATFYPK